MGVYTLTFDLETKILTNRVFLVYDFFLSVIIIPVCKLLLWEYQKY